jgi:hypothetical protein
MTGIGRIVSPIDDNGAVPSSIVGRSGGTAEVDSFNRQQVQLPPIALFEDNFLNDVFDTTATGKWVRTDTGTGTSATVTDRTLFMGLSTAIGKVELVARAVGLTANVGNFSNMIHAISIGANRPAGHVKRFGYRNTAKTDGVYFEIKENTVEWYTLLSGVATLQSDISSVLTDPDVSGGGLGAGKFTLWLIQHLEAGKINIKLAGKQFDTTIAGGATLTGDSEKIPFIEVENTIVTASVPDDLQMHWIKLADENGTKFSLAGKTSRGLLKDVLVGDDGTLPVTVVTGSAPPATVPVKITAKTNMSGTVDTLYTITSGTVLTIQTLSAGAETSNSGHIIELFEDPNGDLSVLNVIEDIYVNGSSDQKTIGENFVGDGTRRILLRRRAFGGGSNDVTGIWQGFEA